MDEAVIMKVIAEQLHVEVEALSPDMVFADLGADSLDLFQITSALEEVFNMEFENGDVEKMKTVADTVGYIKNVLENET
ncbi:MAG: acyl carrier protein [Anaerotignum sp.]